MQSLQSNFLLSASILSANFAKLGQEVNSVLAAGADWIHLDVMDNHYVPNLTVGPMVCSAIRPYAIKDLKHAIVDVHLMIEPVDDLVPAFAKAGANLISFHPEASRHVSRTINLIHEYGCMAGLALNPATPLNILDNVLDQLDLVLLMSVNPGFGGQQFINHTLTKIRKTKNLLDQYNCKSKEKKHIFLEVDGGVNIDNIGIIIEAGADVLVSGSAIFGHKNYKEVIDKMREQVPLNGDHKVL